MTKRLELVIEKLRTLPDEEQDALAELLLSVTGADASAVPLDEKARAAILEGLAQAERGEFVADEAVAESDKRHGILRPMKVRYTPRAFADREKALGPFAV